MLKRNQVKDQSGTQGVRGTQRNKNQELNKQRSFEEKESFDKLPIIGLPIPYF
jgi:hypothetical protein